VRAVAARLERCHGDAQDVVADECAQKLVMAGAGLVRTRYDAVHDAQRGGRADAAAGGARAHMSVVGERHDLAAGDVLGFPGNVAHSYQNPDDTAPSRGVSVVILAKAGV
jgi:hypothetical protein